MPMPMPRFTSSLDVREGPPARAEEAPTFWELLDLGRQPIACHFTLRSALDALREEWPVRTMVWLRRCRRGPDGPVILDEWCVHYDFGGLLICNRAGSIL